MNFSRLRFRPRQSFDDRFILHLSHRSSSRVVGILITTFGFNVSLLISYKIIVAYGNFSQIELVLVGIVEERSECVATRFVFEIFPIFLCLNPIGCNNYLHCRGYGKTVLCPRNRSKSVVLFPCFSFLSIIILVNP